MSVELPETHILTGQMGKVLLNRRIESYLLRDFEKLQKIGFINKDVRAFDQLVDRVVESVQSRGNVIVVKLNQDLNLILAPEYGGRIRYNSIGSPVPERFHLRLDFDDDASFTVTLSGMGVIQVMKDNMILQSYVYRRDFSEVADPLNEGEFKFERFSRQLGETRVNIKSTIVGKDAFVVGLGNSAFQDILYRARIYPKRKASELREEEKQAVFNAIRTMIHERIRLGGKDQFTDLYGTQGRYIPTMGPNMNGRTCSMCGMLIEKMNLGGGQVYFCPKCQK